MFIVWGVSKAGGARGLNIRFDVCVCRSFIYTAEQVIVQCTYEN